jgi:hypothetical protein
MAARNTPLKLTRSNWYRRGLELQLLWRRRRPLHSGLFKATEGARHRRTTLRERQITGSLHCITDNAVVKGN